MGANYTLFRIRLHTSFPLLRTANSCSCIEQTGIFTCVHVEATDNCIDSYKLQREN